MSQGAKIQLFNSRGQRLYLTPDERDKFKETSCEKDSFIRTYALMLCNTGIRPAEAIQLRKSSIDFADSSVIVETKKKRRPGIYRQIPLSDEYLDELNLVHDLKISTRDSLLWPFSIRTAGRKIKHIMDESGISGAMAMSKGLRHGFAVACILKSIPLPVVSKWMGHASIETTAIYMQVMGEEERDLAQRLW